MQANLGPVAVATPQWSPDCPALQPVPKGSWRYPCGVAAPITLTLPFSLACCSRYISVHSFSCLEASTGEA